RARENLLAEGIAGQDVHVTGNTVIDALLHVDALLQEGSTLRAEAETAFSFLSPHKRLLLVTGHRRENFGPGFQQICSALSSLAERSDVEALYPVHLNPEVQSAVRPLLAGRSNIHLVEPQDDVPFVYLMRRAE